MLPGPVFTAELLTSARRTRYYVVRFVYALILLGLVWLAYQESSVRWRNGGGMTIQEMANLAYSLFSTFTTVQVIMVLALTPTLVAGTIAEEKQRKTLHYLLASRLSSLEIVFGKLAARMLHLGVLVLVGLPIMSLLSLFGGIDPVLVLALYGGTFSMGLFLAGLSILASVLVRRVREAITLVYLLELAWLVLPPLVDSAIQLGWPSFYPIYRDAAYVVMATNPFVTMIDTMRGTTPTLAPAVWMFSLQALFGCLFVVLAVWRLRPTFRRQEGSAARQKGLLARLRRWRGRLLPRPSCGDRPMLWKELHVARTSGLVKLVAVGVSVALGAFLFYFVARYGFDAYVELIAAGYTASQGGLNARVEFNFFLRWTSTLIYVLWLLAVAGTAASNVTSEREGDTWTSLISTPLEGEEILLAKMLGPPWSLRALGGLLILLWFIGLALGAVHPLGFIAATIELAVFTWFATALGTFVSLWSKTSMRSQATTMAILFAISGGYLLCCMPFEPGPWILMGCTPAIQTLSLISYDDVQSLFSSVRPSRMREEMAEFVVAAVVGTTGYAAAALALTLAAIGGFDRAVNRPSPILSSELSVPESWG